MSDYSTRFDSAYGTAFVSRTCDALTREVQSITAGTTFQASVPILSVHKDSRNRSATASSTLSLH